MKSRRIVWGLLLGVPGFIVAGILGTVVASWRRPELGVVDGRLQLCPDSPNCVCSYETDAVHGIAPFTAGKTDMDRVRDVIGSQTGFVIIRDDGDYLRVECTTPLLRFVDDLEFLYDADEHVIHVRSASRVGSSDLGANRTRVETIRRQLSESLK